MVVPVLHASPLRGVKPTQIAKGPGDMDEKVDIISRYFRVERYRMVHCYLKKLGGGDIDKLFLVCRKSDEGKKTGFNLEEARKRYEWTYCSSEDV